MTIGSRVHFIWYGPIPDLTLSFAALEKVVYTFLKVSLLGEAAYTSHSFVGLQFHISRAASTSRLLEDIRFTVRQDLLPFLLKEVIPGAS